jgi:C-terminal processing protease CtpA/Prc
MKKNFLGWSALSLAMAIPVSPWGHAQDDPKEEPKVAKSSTFVFQAAGDDLKDVERKVREALEKSGVAEEIKDKVLAELAASAEQIKKQAKEMRIKAEAIKDGFAPMSMQLAGEALKDSGEMLTRVMRVVGDQKYRIGVQTSVTSSKDEDAQAGVVVEAVFPESPASEAGIKEGDVLVKINGEELRSVDQLTKTIQVAGKEGKPVAFVVKRGDDSLDIEVKPSEIKETDRIVESLQMLRSPQSGWVFPDLGVPGQVNVTGQATMSWTQDLKKELEELRKDVREIKEMLKELKKQ